MITTNYMVNIKIITTVWGPKDSVQLRYKWLNFYGL